MRQELQNRLFIVIKGILIIFLALFYLNALAGCSDAIRDWVVSGSGVAPGASPELPVEKTSTWDFSDPTKYSYDENYVEVINGKVRSKQVDQKHSGVDFNSGTYVGTHIDSNSNISLSDSPSLSATHVNTILPNKSGNLVGYWRMDGDWNDSSGLGKNGTSYGGVGFTSFASIGTRAGTFDNTDDYIDIPGDPAHNFGTGNFSVSAWFRRSVTTDWGIIASKRSHTGVTPGWYLGINSTASNFIVFSTHDSSTNQYQISETGTKYIDDNWHLVTAVRSGTELRLYMDGGIVNSVDFGISADIDNSINIRIGRTGEATTFFSGDIDEFSQWNTDLSDDEVFKLYEKQKSNFTELSPSWTPKYSNIVGYWKMDGNWQDSSGNSRHGTSSGTPTFLSNSKVGSYSGNFDGAIDVDRIDVPHDPGFTALNAITAMFWIKFNDLAIDATNDPNLIDTIMVKGDAPVGSDYEWAIYWDSRMSQNKVLFHIEPGGPNSEAHVDNFSDNYQEGVWYHFAAVWDGFDQKIYIDGENATTYSILRTTMVSSPTHNFRLGRGISGRELDGQLDDVAIWNLKLSEAEIKLIYNRQKQKYAGHYDSPIIDLGISGSWTELNPITTLPFYKELTGASGSESSSDYVFLNGDLRSGLVAYWSLNEPMTGTAPMGNDFDDLSGNGNYGIVNSSPTLGKSGLFNSAVLFDQDLERVYLGNPFTTDQNEFTIYTRVFVQKFAIDDGVSNKRTPFYADWNTWSPGSQKGFNIGVFHNRAGFDYFHFSVCDGVNSPAASSDYLSTLTFNSKYEGKWLDLVGVYKSSTFMKIYLNGELLVNKTVGVAAVFSPELTTVDRLGNSGINYGNLTGKVDEVALWNRALTVDEIVQLYRRGANRIKYQVKSCVDSACRCKSLDALGTSSDCDGDGIPNSSDTSDIHFAEWLGKNGAVGEAFSELQNCSQVDNTTGDCDMAAMATVNTAAPKFEFSRYPTAVRPEENRYFQYRVLMEADENAACNNGTTICMPELTSVEVGPTDRYYGGTYSIVPNSPVAFSDLTSISFIEAGSCTLTYQLSPDGSTYYYWDGSKWISAIGVAQSANSATLSSNISTFSSQIGTGNLFWKAFMNSNTVESCEIEEIAITATE